MHVVFGEVACPFSGLQMMCCVRQRSAMTFSFSTRSASNKSLRSAHHERPSTAIDGRLHDTRGCWRNERPFGLSHRMMM